MSIDPIVRRLQETPQRRKLWYGVAVVGVVAVVIFALNAVYGFVGGASSTTGSERTVTVVRGTVQSAVTASGNVGVARSAAANFSTSGTVTSVKVEVGDVVRAGQQLATLDSAAAEANLETAKANLAEAEATLASARSGPTAEQQASNASSLHQAELQVTSAKQQLQADQEAFATAKKQLADSQRLNCPPVTSSSAASSPSSSGSNSSSSQGSETPSASGASTPSASSSPSSSGSTGGGGSSNAAAASPGTGDSAAAGGGSSTPSGAGDAPSAGGGSSPNQFATNQSAATAATSAASTATTGQASGVTSSSATLGGTVDPGGLATTYRFQYGTSPSSLSLTTSSQDAGSGSGAVPVAIPVTGLSPGRNYWFRVVATNSAGTANGALGMFTTGQATLATTGQATPVAATSATLNGTVSPGGLKTSYSFEYGTSATSLTARTPQADAGSDASAVPVSAAITGLKASTTYYFRLVATSSAATTDGAIASFTTAAPTVTVTTGQATTVGATAAEVTGAVNPGGLATTYRFEYGTSGFSASTAAASAGSGSGSVSVTATLTGLKPNTAYLFRLVASNASGSSTGVQSSFITSKALAPTASTGSASAASTTNMTLTGSVNPNGSATTYWFEYGTTSSYGSKTPAVDGGSDTATTQVSALVTGLKPDTTYVFRLVAKNAVGTSNGVSQIATTQQTSCAEYAQTVADAEQTVANQEAAVETAELNLAQVEASIASSSVASPASIAQDEAAVKQARATVAENEKALAATVLVAPIAGTVTAVNGAAGSTVSAAASTVSVVGQSSTDAASSSSSSIAGGGGSTSSSASGFVTIDSLHQLVVTAGFAEADAGDIRVGQPATLTFPALTDTEVAGRVVSVANSSTVVSNVVTYDATIALVNPPADVKQGMTTDVSVATSTRKRVLVLPTAAITTNGTISTVQVQRGGETTVARVTTGLVGNSTTEIVSGLKAGDVVVEPTVNITASSTSPTTGARLGGGGAFPTGGGFGPPGG